MTAASVAVSSRLGAAIAAGVPVLVLVSMGPVAALAGPPSAAVWVLSAVVGFLMALMFAELAGAHRGVNGGVAVLAAVVLRPRSRALARLGQWSYWLGWSPALAINGLLVGTYTQQLLAPHAPAWVAVLLATAVLAVSVAVNHLGMRVGGRMQAVLVACVACVVVVLFSGALIHGDVHLGHFVPFAPPGGWLSTSGWFAIAGGLFLAGWSAYGSELALTYATRYRTGVRDAVHVLATVAAVSVLAFGLIPFLLLATIGVDAVQRDPAEAFAALSQRSTDGASVVVLGALTLALLLGLNMIAIASSWTLHQMAHSGDAWRFLGRLNRHGMPGNALVFDLAVNVGLLVVITVLADGNTTQLPVALLAAANVGYFVSMCLALVAAWLNHRHVVPGALLRLRPGLVRLVPPIIGFNIVLLATAGHAWGWRNVAIGAVVLVGVTLLATRGTGRTAPRQPAVVLPACWGQAGAAVHHVVGEAPALPRGRHDGTRTYSLGSGTAPVAGTADRP
jgi:amino acid transporter